MSMTDPIADLLTRIRNAQLARHEAVEIPLSGVKKQIAEILEKEGYIAGFKITEKNPVSTLTVQLKYDANRDPIIRTLRRVSKPGRRVYAGRHEIPQVLGGLGITIVSTSEGIMTDREARERGVGGEIMVEIS